MRFSVPQFIDVEDKLFGPLTLKQFIYLAGGGGMIFILYRFLNFYLAIIPIVAVAALSLALAFYKVNDKPFIDIVEAAFRYLTGAKLYIWKKVEKKAVKKEATEVSTEKLYVPKLSDSKLKDLAWSLDIKETLNPVSKEDTITNKY